MQLAIWEQPDDWELLFCYTKSDSSNVNPHRDLRTFNHRQPPTAARSDFPDILPARRLKAFSLVPVFLSPISSCVTHVALGLCVCLSGKLSRFDLHHSARIWFWFDLPHNISSRLRW